VIIITTEKTRRSEGEELITSPCSAQRLCALGGKNVLG